MTVHLKVFKYKISKITAFIIFATRRLKTPYNIKTCSTASRSAIALPLATTLRLPAGQAGAGSTHLGDV